jgi:hypothetical protein
MPASPKAALVWVITECIPRLPSTHRMLTCLVELQREQPVRPHRAWLWTIVASAAAGRANLYSPAGVPNHRPGSSSHDRHAVLLGLPVYRAVPLNIIGAAVYAMTAAGTQLSPADLSTDLSSLIGIGGAPLIVGMLSDAYAHAYGSSGALQRALAIAVSAAVIGSVFLLLAYGAASSAGATEGRAG